MPSRTDTAATTAENWLAQFERVLAGPNDVLLKNLFHADSHWRDVLALTWRIRTVSGVDTILRELKAHVGRARPTLFRTNDPHHVAPRHVTRAGTDTIEAIFTFETAEGRGSGVLRLTPDVNDGNTLKAWTLLTALDEIKGHEEQTREITASGQGLFTRFSGPQLARPQESCRRVCRPRSRRARCRRRTGRALDRRTPHSIAGRHADRRSRTAHRRQLAQPLSRAGPAQPNARQPPSVHALSTELGRPIFPKTKLPLGSRLMWKAWSSTIGRPPNSRAARTTKKRGDGLSCSAVRTAQSGRCTRGTSSWPPESAVFRAFRIFRRCATSAALFSTPANRATARRGEARKSLSSARAIAATILRRTCTRAEQRSRSFNAVRP